MLTRGGASHPPLLAYMKLRESTSEVVQMRKIVKSFYDWCVENNRMDLNDRFDEGKNMCTSKDVSYRSNKNLWFKCPRNLHDSEQHVGHVVTKNEGVKLECHKCNSIAQVIIDKFGDDYLWSHWHPSNILNPWDVAYGHSRLKIAIQCSAVEYHVYDQTPQSFGRGIGCPYCNGKMVHPMDSLSSVYPEIINRWSSKNDLSPYCYTPRSNKGAWLMCPVGKHDDYFQSLNNAYRYQYRCPECSKDDLSKRVSGSGNHFWKGGVNGANDNLRHHREYIDWRASVYERDDYTCQCCGARGGKLNAHHLNSFADYPDFRYNIDNGITMCVMCHDATEPGSFHNLYGTHGTTPSQLREYILCKSNKDIYQTNPNLLYNINNTKLTCAV